MRMLPDVYIMIMNYEITVILKMIRRGLSIIRK